MTGPVEENPFPRFGDWLEVAGSRERRWAKVMALATVDGHGRPSSRAVLLTGWDQRGLVFFTDQRSRKAAHLAGNDWAAAVFLWPVCQRQVRVEGRIAELAGDDSDSGFAATPLPARLAVWAARQDEVIPDREVLEHRLGAARLRFGDGEVPRPPWWRGYRLGPVAFEFWEARPDALHDRLRYRLVEAGTWMVERLAP